MTLQAARMLDEAWALHMRIASADDSSPISWQTPSWEAPCSAYDFSALTVKALLPHAYGYSVTDTPTTEAIYSEMIDCGEVIALDHPWMKDVLAGAHWPHCDMPGCDHVAHANQSRSRQPLKGETNAEYRARLSRLNGRYEDRIAKAVAEQSADPRECDTCGHMRHELEHYKQCHGVTSWEGVASAVARMAPQ